MVIQCTNGRPDHRYQEGWPKIAAEKNYIHNSSYHRRFGVFSQRILDYFAGRLAMLEKQLYEFDNSSESHRKTLSAYQKREAGQACVKGKLDDIMLEAAEVLDKYCKSITAPASLVTKLNI
jgi:hypothetical protein